MMIKLVLVGIMSFLICIFASSTYSIELHKAVGIWLFDEGEGDIAADSSGNGHDGQILAGVQWAEGTSGGALEFSGQGKADYVRIPHEPSMDLVEHTITAWVKMTPTKVAPTEDAWQLLVGRWQPLDVRNYSIMARKDSGIILSQFTSGGSRQYKTVIGKTELADGGWRHVASTYDGDVLRIYVDGVMEAEIACSAPDINSGDLTIGAALGGLYPTKGVIDDVGLFNVALGDGEIRAIMANGLRDALGLAAAQEMSRAIETAVQQAVTKVVKEEKAKKAEPSASTKVVSGVVRLRGEARSDKDFDSSKDDKVNFVGQRTWIKFAGEVKKAKAVIQLQHTKVWGGGLLTGATPKDFGSPESVDVDLHQGYMELSKAMESGTLTAKLGRQELSYGDQRLVGAFGWSNNGRAFDAAKLICSLKDLSLDVWAAKALAKGEERGGVTGDFEPDFFGLYATLKPNPQALLDVYGMLLRQPDAGEDMDDALLYTIGARAKGRLSQTPLDWSGEFAYQFGDRMKVEHSAFALDAQAGFTIPNAWTPRLSVEYAYATGNDPDSDKSEEFHNLFPTNHNKYGYIDYFGWRNMQDIRGGVSAKPHKQLAVAVDYHIFSLAEAQGNWKNAGGGLMRKSAPSSSTFVGTEFDVTLNYACQKNVRVIAGYSHFFAGDFIEETGPDDDSDWGFVQVQTSF